MGQLYRDIHFDFAPHPLTGDIGRASGIAAIEQSLRNIVLTAQYERPFQPTLYGNIQALLFEPASQATIQKIESNLQSAVSNHEPRVEQVRVEVTRVEVDKYTVTVFFRQRATTETEQVQIYLNRDQ